MMMADNLQSTGLNRQIVMFCRRGEGWSTRLLIALQQRGDRD